MQEPPGVERDRSPGVAGYLRAGARGFVFLVVTAFLYLLHIVAVPALGATGAGSSGRRLSSRLVRSWARMTCRILGMRVTVEGDGPRPPFLLVANHLSYVDVLVLLSHLDCVFVSRADAAGWPLFGALCRVGGTIFLDRDRVRQIPRAMREMESTLESGRGVVLFPEGGTSAGDEVLPFRPSLLEVASVVGLPVSYASLTYETPSSAPSAREAICWWGGMTLLPHLIRLSSLPGFRATVRFGDRTFPPEDRKVMAEKLWEAVRALFRPVAP